MRNTVYQTFKTLINLCALKGTPANLPFSYYLLGTLIALEAIVDITSWSQLKAPLLEVVLACFLSLSVLMGVIYFLLAQQKKEKRFVKVMTAWIGTELILDLLLKLFVVVLPENIPAIKAFVFILFFIWYVMIKAQILKQSIEMRMVMIILIVFGIMLISQLPAQLILEPYIPQIVPQS